MTRITKIDEFGRQTIEATFVNSFSAKENLISFIEQNFNRNMNWWTYPKDMDGIKQTKYGASMIDIGTDTYIARIKED